MTFYLHQIPFSPIDSFNRRAAAQGSPRYAQQTSYADYNGHHLTVSWNEYRGYYITQYWWGGRVVLRRGTFAQCLDAALAEYRRGALGTSCTIVPREDDEEAIRLCQETPLVQSEEDKREWYTWQHKLAAAGAKDYANPGAIKMVFDWPLMQAAKTEEEYIASLRAKYKSEFAF